MSQTPRWDGLVDRVVAVLPKTTRGNPDPQPLADFLRKDRNQVWQWIAERKVLPNGEVALAILDFVNKKEADAAK